MSLLAGKKALIFGVANDHSIAWGIAQAFHEQGASVGFSSVEIADREARPAARRAASARRSSSRATSRTTRRSTASSQRWNDAVRPARHPRPRPCVRQEGGPRGPVRRHLARRLHACARRQRLLARGAWLAARRAAHAERRLDHDALLLRRREGRRQLQRDGRGQGRARGERALPGRRPRAAGHPRQRHQRRPDPHPRRLRRGRLPAMYGMFQDVAPLRRNITIEDVGGTAVYLASDLSAASPARPLRRRRLQRLGVPTPES